MSFYDFNISSAVQQLVPPDKRRNNLLNIAYSIIAAPLQWAHDLLFNTYLVGSSDPIYSPGTYNYQDKVIYNKQVYSSLIANNTDAPTTSNWILVSNTFIGVQERVLYNSAKLTFEYALNKEFGTTFRQPNDPVTPTHSDIYITALAAVPNGFRIGSTNTGSSSIGASSASASIGGTYPFVYLNNFTINVPSAVLTAQTPQAIRAFANNYKAVGLNFTITSY
jgi:hypothetical protein